MTTGWSIAIDRELCIGSGMCIVYASGTFVHDDASKAVLIEPSTDDLETIRNAVSACPMGALELLEQGT